MKTPYYSEYVEVIGKVTGADTIAETLPALSLGDNFGKYHWIYLKIIFNSIQYNVINILNFIVIIIFNINLDLESYDKLVQYQRKFPEIF